MSSWVAALPELLTHLTILFLLPFLTYWDAIWKGGWVSDDCTNAPPEAPPISRYEGKLQRPVNWGSLSKLFRYHFGRIPNPNPKWKEEKQAAFVPLARAHHRLNVWVLSGITVLAYLFLSHFVSPFVAFLAVVLFCVHPTGSQTVAWVSGCNYLFGAFFMFLGLNIVMLSQQFSWMQDPLTVMATLGCYALVQWMAGESVFQMAGVIVILLWLKAWPFAIVAGLISLWQCTNTFREAVTLRKKTFEAQQMGEASRIHWKKAFVVAKLLYYNVKLSFFPKHLGLYSDYFTHYLLPHTEAEDRYFWWGGVTALGFAAGILFGPPPVQLSLLWFLAFIAMFSGVLIVNQTVVDRYVWLPTFGMCLLVSWMCVTFGWLWLLYVLGGIALMRTWAHLYTYEDEEMFYFSNLLNFRNSDMAYGNLGVIYLGQGWIELAVGNWARGIQVNPDYDVCWFNLASLFKSRGPLNPNYFPRFFNTFPKDVLEMAFAKDPTRQHLHLARYCLKRALESKICHFPKQWKEEMVALDQELSRPVGAPPVVAKLVTPLVVAPGT